MIKTIVCVAAGIILAPVLAALVFFLAPILLPLAAIVLLIFGIVRLVKYIRNR